MAILRKNIFFTVSVTVILVSIIILVSPVLNYAHRIGLMRGLTTPPALKPSYPPNIHPSPMPPGFPNTWLYQDVIRSFNEDGLEVKEVKPVTEAEHTALPARAFEAMRFSFSKMKKEMEGYIYSFDNSSALEKIQKYYLDMNGRGKLYTWSFVKDNIILVLSGSVPEEDARQYESALKKLRK